jgi:CheY-like chemotaxis protein
MDGIDLLRNIRQQYPMVKSIMITGYVTQENLLACMRHGAETCIFKPLTDLAELDGSVNTAIAFIDLWKRKMYEIKGLKPN